MSDYYRLDIDIQPKNNDAADLLAAFLADAGFESFEETSLGIAAYVKTEDFNPEDVNEIINEFPMDVKLSWEMEKIEHTDWNEEWEKKYFKPLVLADGRCVVHSSFHKEYPAAEVDIVVDPKMAFGTGHHATTSMMVNFLFETELKDKTVIDMGTGTGILAIVAKKLQSGRTIGIEIDPCAYENALENISLNHTEVLLLQGNASLLEGTEKVDIFLANINRNIILEDMKKYVMSIKPGGILFLSGFYISDVVVIEEALNLNGMKIAEVKKEAGDWAAIKAFKDN